MVPWGPVLAFAGGVTAVIIGQLLNYHLQVKPDREARRQERRTDIRGRLHVLRRQVMVSARRAATSFAMMSYTLMFTLKPNREFREMFEPQYEEAQEDVHESHRDLEDNLGEVSRLLVELEATFTLTDEERQLVKTIQGFSITDFQTLDWRSELPPDQLTGLLHQESKTNIQIADQTFNQPMEQLIESLREKDLD